MIFVHKDTPQIEYARHCFRKLWSKIDTMLVCMGSMTNKGINVKLIILQGLLMS